MDLGLAVEHLVRVPSEPMRKFIQQPSGRKESPLSYKGRSSEI